MNMNFLFLYCALCFINVVLQTIKSLCTVKCNTLVSACVNAVAYGLYTYVIFFTNAEGLSLFGKACITAAANFSGVYLANFLFSKLFTKDTEWKVEVSVPRDDTNNFMNALREHNLIFHYYGANSDMAFNLFTIYCPSRKESATLASLLPQGSKYNISENIKRL